MSLSFKSGIDGEISAMMSLFMRFLFVAGLFFVSSLGVEIAHASSSVVGQLDVFENIKSPQLGNSRTIRVLLPADYHQNPTRRYPVIYLHDGENGFDDQSADGGYEWQIDEALAKLGGETGVGAIVVGIDAFMDQRGEEFDYNLFGAKYAAFLIETIKPWIDQAYRTDPRREATFTMGSSWGGNISLALVWRHPEVFSSAACLSIAVGSRWKSMQKMLADAPLPSLPVRFYLDHGDTEGEETYAQYVSRLAKDLLQRGVPAENVVYREFRGHGHSATAWRLRSPHTLRWLLTNSL